MTPLEQIEELGRALDDAEMQQDILALVTAKNPPLLAVLSLAGPNIAPRIEWVNSAWAMIGGLSVPPEGIPIDRVLHPSDRARFRRALRADSSTVMVRVAVAGTYRSMAWTLSHYDAGQIFALVVDLGEIGVSAVNGYS